MSFATPIVGSGPSFLRDDAPNSSGPGVNGSGRPELKSENSNGGGAGNVTGPAASTTAKRKSPGIEEGGEGAGEAKKVKTEG
jgi:MADS-box transcription factor